MKYFLIVLLFSSSIIAGYSQTKFKPGYVVTIGNDTLSGFLLDKIDAEMAYKVKFKSELNNSQVKTFEASELLGFGFDNGRIFDRLDIKKPNEPSVSTVVLAKKTITGKIDLWILRHVKGKAEIILTNNESRNTVHLTSPQKSKITTADGKVYNKKDQKYLGLINYVKRDSTFVTTSSLSLKYSEKKIKNDIIEYNKLFDQNYPVGIYSEASKLSFEILAGIQIIPSQDVKYLRAGVFVNKSYLEKSRKVSFVKGITWLNSTNVALKNKTIDKGHVGYREQWINILPFGIKYHADNKVIQPYAYMGVGLAFIINYQHQFEDYQLVDETNGFLVIPTISLRFGTEIKLGSKAILLELVPAGFESAILSLGFKF